VTILGYDKGGREIVAQEWDVGGMSVVGHRMLAIVPKLAVHRGNTGQDRRSFDADGAPPSGAGASRS
jgi:hypothetical protein